MTQVLSKPDKISMHAVLAKLNGKSLATSISRFKWDEGLEGAFTLTFWLCREGLSETGVHMRGGLIETRLRYLHQNRHGEAWYGFLAVLGM